MAHIKSRKHQNSTRLLALVAATVPVAVAAQTSETMLPSMTVKAGAEVPYKAEKSASQKFTQPLVDTPQTVQVIKKEILQEQGAATLMDALRNTPGITMQLGENGNTSAGDTVADSRRPVSRSTQRPGGRSSVVSPHPVSSRVTVCREASATTSTSSAAGPRPNPMR